MQVLNFIKKLQIFKVVYGRASLILRGLKDGGAKAVEINDPSIARVYNGSTIFNVNSPANECGGGHFHTVDVPTSTLVQNCYFSRSGAIKSNTWLLADTKPSNVSGHVISLTSPVLKKIGINCSIPSTLTIEIYQHNGIVYTPLTTASFVNQRSVVVDVDVQLTVGLELAIKVTVGDGRDIDANLIVVGV